MIEMQHPLKPSPVKQKFLYAGKLLGNQEILKEVLGSVNSYS